MIEIKVARAKAAEHFSCSDSVAGSPGWPAPSESMVYASMGCASSANSGEKVQPVSAHGNRAREGSAARSAVLALLLLLSSCAPLDVDLDRLQPCGAHGKPDTSNHAAAILRVNSLWSLPSTVDAIDGQPFKPQWCNIDRIALEPGRHRLLVSYPTSPSLPGLQGGGVVAFDFESKPNASYAIRITRSWSGSRYTCSLFNTVDGKDIITTNNCYHTMSEAAFEELHEIWGSMENYWQRYDRLRDVYNPPDAGPGARDATP